MGPVSVTHDGVLDELAATDPLLVGFPPVVAAEDVTTPEVLPCVLPCVLPVVLTTPLLPPSPTVKTGTNPGVVCDDPDDPHPPTDNQRDTPTVTADVLQDSATTFQRRRLIGGLLILQHPR
jgi:hypothetical protein